MNTYCESAYLEAEHDISRNEEYGNAEVGTGFDPYGELSSGLPH